MPLMTEEEKRLPPAFGLLTHSSSEVRPHPLEDIKRARQGGLQIFNITSKVEIRRHVFPQGFRSLCALCATPLCGPIR